MAPLDFKHFTSARYRPGEDDAINYYAQKRKKQYHGNEGKDVKELSMKPDKKLPNLKVPVKGKKGQSKFMRKQLITKAKDDINASVQSADRKPEKYMKPDGKIGIRMVRTDKEVVKKEQMQVFRVGHKDMSGNVHATDPDDAMKKLRKIGLKGDIKLTHRGSVKSMPKRRIPTREELDSKDKPFVKKLIGKLRKGSNTHAKQADDLEKAMKTEVSVLKPTKPTDIIKHAKTLAKNPRDYMMNKKKYLDKARAKVFRMYPKEEVEIDEAIKHTHAVVDPAGKVAGMTSNERDAKDIARRHKGKVIKLKRPMSTKKGEMMINRPFKEAINHDDAHRDSQTHSDGSMSVKKIPSMIKKPGDKHLHLHMKSYHKEKDGQDFAKKHGYKVKNYVKTPSGTRMDIHKEEVNVDEALTLQQRMKRSRLMKRLKTRIKIGRDRARRKMANKKTLEKRSMRQARAQLAKKLTRGIPKAELTFARKKEIEKRLEKPALQQRIKRIAKRLFKDVRKKEVQRKKG